MNFEEIKKNLKEVSLNYINRNTQEMFDILIQLKKEAVKINNQVHAKEIWCIEQILELQSIYISAFEQFQSGEYYSGWCSLERAEITYVFLNRHFKDENAEYWLEFIYKHISQFQDLFPYKLFMSPEFIKKEVKCSICNKVISIRNRCGHKVGEIYDGEMCGRIISNADFLGIALVHSPVQKYSVPFINDTKKNKSVDHYNYSLVKFVTDRLQSPFHGWDIYWTRKRHPHSRYKDIGQDEDCPCESGKKYKDCCLSKPGVLRPHCEIVFSVPPLKGLPMFEYSD